MNRRHRMRSLYLKIVMLGAAFLGLIASLSTAQAQTTLLVDWGSTWKYLANTNRFTTNSPVPIWCTNNFNDAAWPSAAGIIWAENDPGATEPDFTGAYAGTPSYNSTAGFPLPTTNQFGTYIQTYYFRIPFNYSGPTLNVALQLETVVDDGVVFYLNGRELPGTRINMPTTAVDWTTSASGTITESGFVTNSVVITNISAADLRSGPNVLAAEVHQSGGGSSDIAFGMRLLSRPLLPPTITAQPLPLIRGEIGTATNISVTVTGDGPFTYQWYSSPAGTPSNLVAGANQRTFNIYNYLHPTNALNYRCVISSAIGRATSSVCTVQVYVNPLVFTLQPTNQTVIEGDGLIMATATSGSVPVYRWQRYTNLYLFNTNHARTSTGWTNLLTGYNPSSVSNIFTISPISGVKTNEAGFYRVFATNWSYAATSIVAQLTVPRDTFGPTILSADATEYSGIPFMTNILVNFSEAVNGTLARTNVNYSVVDTNTGMAYPIARIVGAGQAVRAVSLEFDQATALPAGPNHHYVLTVNNIRDVRPGATNIMAPNCQIGVSVVKLTTIIEYGDDWRYFIGDDFFYSSDIESYWEPANQYAWRTNNFEAPVPFYNVGPSLLYFDTYSDLTNVCGAAQSTVIPISSWTYYFMKTFVLPTVDPRARLQMDTMVDDGAVYYLNGVEIGRENMPAGRIYSTNSAASSQEFACRTNFFNASNLRAGTNFLAVEVHQYGPDYPWQSSDICFGAQLTANITTDFVLPQPTNAPTLNMVRQGNLLTLSWEPGGYALEYASNPGSTWLQVQPNMANPYRVTMTTGGSPRFWRLKRVQF